MKIAQRILEASFNGRSWEGRLKKIDQLLAWMYDKEIMNKGERKRKDSLFNRYYRYYNDGDFPRGLGIRSGANKNVIQKALEDALDDFMKSILSKYLGKIDRKEFHYDNQVKDIKFILKLINEEDYSAISSFWKKDIKDESILKLINDSDALIKNLKSRLPKKYANNSISYSRETGGSDWTSEFESEWKKIAKIFTEVEALLENILTSLKRARKLDLLTGK